MKSRKPDAVRSRVRRRLDRLHRYEETLREQGFRLIGGIDEVGRGPLAGPVVAACVVTDGPLRLRHLNDSKQVPAEFRADLADEIKAKVVAWAIGEASVAEIDRINIYWASVLAMERALAALAIVPEYLITDAVRIRSWTGKQEPMIKADATCASVAAASVIAKVYRDALLAQLDPLFPEYGFAENKGYATPYHIEALKSHGPCSMHRRNWWRVQAALTLPGIEFAE
ncbi:MAG TPA: ribonuclease HII [Candidatus Baltobacteraceae bacterium]